MTTLLNREEMRKHFDSIALQRDTWKKKNWYYYREIERLCRFAIPEGSSVLEIGCGTGDLLAAVKPKRGVGLDFSPQMVKIAQHKYPELEFQIGEAESLEFGERFDYVILSDLVGYFDDIQQAFGALKRVTGPDTRVIITYYNYLWEPILKLGERFGLKIKQPIQNWLPLSEIENLLYLSEYEVVKKGHWLLFPKYIPLFSAFVNRVMAELPFFRKLCLIEVIIAKESGSPQKDRDYTTSVIIPCRNEKGNVEEAVARIPKMGSSTEIIFVDGSSADGTVEEIERITKKYPKKDIRLIHQGEGRGKGDAVRKGFSAACGAILMILDADLTVQPEDLPKFYDVLAQGKGEFINGSRMVYQMEDQAMRCLNILGNKFFSLAFTYLLEQKFRDTLCGTKVLFRRDYEKIVRNRHFFGDFDPFGDFDLIFGASKLNLKIVEIPVRYKERTYGETKISRFTHGWLLLKMCGVAFWKLKMG